MIQNYQPQKVMQKVFEAKRKLCGLLEEERLEVMETLNKWQWDERIGEKPEKWDLIMNCNHSIIPKITKFSYLKPLFDYYDKVLSKKL